MTEYRCPYCNVLIQHKPELAGSAVTCSKCQESYYEPTDPLPGVQPEKVLPAEEIEIIGEGQLGCGPVVLKLPTMVEGLDASGLRSIVLTRNPENEKQVNMNYPGTLSAEQANQKVIQIAISLLPNKSP